MTRSSFTPLMEQYREIKSRHQDAILFFRMGDFYEMFYDDAVVAARTLGLTLTSRNNGGAADVPLAGVPVKAVNEYLRRLVERGFRVSICEQMEDPKQAKGIVRREVVETVTPGAVFADDLLDGARANYLVAVVQHAKRVGIAAIDVSTGAFRLLTTSTEDGAAAMARLSPREVLVPRGKDAPADNRPPEVGASGALVTERDDWEFDSGLGREEIQRRFGVQSLDGFGIEATDEPAVAAASALLRYVQELLPAGLAHLAAPRVERAGDVISLDEMTRRNLELVESLRGDAGAAGTLLGVLDRTLTPMGSRLIRDWILAPLSARGAIDTRLDAVAAMVKDPVTRDLLRESLDGVRDLERLAGKISSMRASPRETAALGHSLSRLPLVGEALRRVEGSELLRGLAAEWDDCAELSAEIRRVLVADPPHAIGDEPAIRESVDQALDELRVLRDGGKDAIARIQADERARTGITSLKVGFNRVFGYFIEVTNANSHLVPADFQRRQTLAGAERYVTPALKEFEERVLGATEKIEARERKLFDALRSRIAGEIRRVQLVAARLAKLDVLASFADAAEREGYTRPEMTDEFDIDIIAGRHPVVERMMPRERFIPNDVRLTANARVIVLTGPNMAGKSTILRQVGLIVLMAHAGSFVPARGARIGLVDRVFTRVGASDNLVRGQSTFMVEMSETSAILNCATERSLVLLDEIGRGTSTYDGVSIAWAVTEHIHNKLGCKTIFATHYHELMQLADELDGVRNYNVGVKEAGSEIVFLHRLEPGGADRSYGIEVGRLAGLPAPVLARARAVLRILEAEHLATPAREPSAAEQLGLFGGVHPVVQRLRQIDVDSLTPRQALDLLARVVDEARET